MEYEQDGALLVGRGTWVDPVDGTVCCWCGQPGHMVHVVIGTGPDRRVSRGLVTEDPDGLVVRWPDSGVFRLVKRNKAGRTDAVHYRLHGQRTCQGWPSPEVGIAVHVRMAVQAMLDRLCPTDMGGVF